MPIFWESVAIPEFTRKTPIIATTSDGASPNKKFYRMHCLISDIADEKVVYHNQKIFAPNR